MQLKVSFSPERLISLNMKFLRGLVEIKEKERKIEIIFLRRFSFKMKRKRAGQGRIIPRMLREGVFSLQGVQCSISGDPGDPFVSGVLYPFFPGISFWGEPISGCVLLKVRISLLRLIKVYYNIMRRQLWRQKKSLIPS